MKKVGDILLKEVRVSVGSGWGECFGKRFWVSFEVTKVTASGQFYCGKDRYMADGRGHGKVQGYLKEAGSKINWGGDAVPDKCQREEMEAYEAKIKPLRKHFHSNFKPSPLDCKDVDDALAVLALQLKAQAIVEGKGND